MFLIMQFADVRHIVMTLLWRLMTSLYDVNLNVAYITSITTSAYQTHENSRILSYPGKDYKDLSLVGGVDRKIRPEDHCLTGRGLPCDAGL